LAAVQDGPTCRTARGPITFRISINVDDIILNGGDIFGDGVNIAARVESECEPSGVYLSHDTFRQIRGKTPLEFEDAGVARDETVSLILVDDKQMLDDLLS
jgi:adenylate cyclase